MAFVRAKPESGFEIFSRTSNLEKRFRKADLVLTGEGAIDQQTLMGKGVGQVALLCKRFKIPCIGIAGTVSEPKKAQKTFHTSARLAEITSLENAKATPEEYLAE